MPDTEHTEIVERLRAFGDELTTDDRWNALVTRARARRRRRSAATIAAAAAVVAVVAGGLAVARPGASRNAGPVPAASPSPSGIDPWADPWSPDPNAPHKQTVAAYKGGVRLALLRDDKGTYAITAGMDRGQICFRVGAAVPAGSQPLLSSAGCSDDGKRALWVPSSGRVADRETAFVLVAPQATQLVWEQGAARMDVELHDLPGSGRKVALLAAPRLPESRLVAVAGSRTLATYEFPAPTPEPPRSLDAPPTAANAVALFTYGGGTRFTLWAQRRSDGQIHFVGTTPGVPGDADTFQGVPPGPDKAVREASLDRVTFGERWVCGTAEDEVRSVVYRLADGRTVQATLHQVPKGGRVWCVKLPRERLDEPPVKGDLIVATLRNGTTYEVAPKY